MGRSQSSRGSAEPQGQVLGRSRLRTPLGLGLISAVLLFAALPPLGWWPVAWVAPLGWLYLIRSRGWVLAKHDDKDDNGNSRPTHRNTGPKQRKRKSKQGDDNTFLAPTEENTPSRSRRWINFWMRPYPAIWLSGFVFWMAVLHWLRLPHWATFIGWFALSFYLAFYLPVFVGLSRVLTHSLRISVIFSAPLVWTGLEFARDYMLTGFSMAQLGHSQYQSLWLIQVADLGGSFAVSFVVMFVAACIARIVPLPDRLSPTASGSALSWSSFWPVAPAVVLVGGVLWYGAARTALPSADPDKTLRVALIQASFDTEFREIKDRDINIDREYTALSRQAVAESSAPIDLIVWPESMYREPLITADAGAIVPPEMGISQEEFELGLSIKQREFESRLRARIGELSANGFLAGLGREHYGRGDYTRYNSAIFARRGQQPEWRGTYDKMHAVPFGEYFPFGKYMPWLYEFSPLGKGIEEGSAPALFELNGVTFSPSICFESIQSHHIRDSVVQLRDTRGEPDLLVNVTNDGWFWGSSELDLHLICAVFRAVECRKPFLVAANTGISAVIDGNGTVLRRGPKRANDVIVHDVSADPRSSPFLDYGPWIPWICLSMCGLAAVWGLAVRWHKPRAKNPADPSPAGATVR